MRVDLNAMGLRVGEMEPGARNRITDVPGVRVGHTTIDNERHKTGVTVVLPCRDNPFERKLLAAAHVINGYGKTLGLMQTGELGQLETPIALTNTLNVGLVHDALIQYMIDEGTAFTSINPLVCECNDATLNDIRERVIGYPEVCAAIESATEEFAEGDVGAGKGTACHGLKGGIGTASRRIFVDGEEFVLGVLVQTNHGCLRDLRLDGRPVGAELARLRREAERDRGSCIIVMATNLPLSCRQLGRVLRRAPVGLVRLGSYIGHNSGEVAVGFTTANRLERGKNLHAMRILEEELLDDAFRAMAEATEEAVLRAMFEAKSVGCRVSLREALRQIK